MDPELGPRRHAVRFAGFGRRDAEPGGQQLAESAGWSLAGNIGAAHSSILLNHLRLREARNADASLALSQTIDTEHGWVQLS